MNPSASVFLLFVGLALFAGGVAVPTAQASCLVVVLGTCGTGCNPVAGVGCGTNDCAVVVLSDCLGTGSCTVTTFGPAPNNDCGGSCVVSMGFCDPATGTPGDGPADCTVNVGSCLGNGDCVVNVVTSNTEFCNGDCTVNIHICYSPGSCDVNLDVCSGACTVNIGLCNGRCTVNVDPCTSADQCLVNLAICGP